MGNFCSKLNLKCCVGLKKKTDKHKQPVEEETTDPDSIKVAITGKQGQPYQQDFGDATYCNSADGYAANSGASQEPKCPKETRKNPNKEKKSVKSNKKYLKEKSSHRKHHKKHYQYDSDSSTDSSDSYEGGGIGHVRTQIIENAKIVNIGKGNKVIDRSKTITYNVTPQSNVPTKTKDTKPTRTAINTSVGGWAGFRKQVDDKRAARGIQLRIKASESVGIIRGCGTVGTGFLVGNLHIMTALHVIKDLKDITGEHLKPERAKELSIQFRYLSCVDNNRPENFFYFQQNIAYENTALDVVVLELKPDGENQTQLPMPLKHFSPIHSNWDVSMYGHPGGEVLQEDPGIKIFNLMPETLKEAKEWSIQNFHENGYHGIEDNRKILFHCLFGKGASGSPGLYAPEYLDNASVVWMLIRGYPGFHYEKDHDKVGDEYLIEQGVTMTSIWEDMKRTNPGLCKTIFGDQDLSPNL